MLTYTLCSVTWNITLNTKKKKTTQYCYFEIKGMFESRKKWNIFITKGNYPSVTDYICPQWLLLILMRKKLLLEDVENCFEYLCYQTTPHNIRKLSITEPLPILKSHSWVSTECFSLHYTSTVAWSKQCWEQSICAELSITNSYQTFSEADPSLLQIYLAWRHSSTSSRECSLTHASAAAAGWMRGKITQNTALSAR